MPEAGLVFLFNDTVCLEEGHKVEVDPSRPGEMEEPAPGFFPNRAFSLSDFNESSDNFDVTTQCKSLYRHDSSVIRKAFGQCTFTEIENGSAGTEAPSDFREGFRPLQRERNTGQCF